MAITLIPVAVIPQIILSGVIAPLEGLSKGLAQWFITVYWGNRGLDSLLTEQQAKLGGLEQGSFMVAILVLCLHAGVCVVAALGILLWQGRGARAVAHCCGWARRQAALRRGPSNFMGLILFAR